MSSRKIRRSRKKNNYVVPVIIIFTAVTFSALAAAVWQLVTPQPPEVEPLELDPSVLSQFDEDAIAVAVSSAKPESSSSDEPEKNRKLNPSRRAKRLPKPLSLRKANLSPQGRYPVPLPKANALPAAILMTLSLSETLSL